MTDSSTDVSHDGPARSATALQAGTEGLCWKGELHEPSFVFPVGLDLGRAVLHFYPVATAVI